MGLSFKLNHGIAGNHSIDNLKISLILQKFIINPSFQTFFLLIILYTSENIFNFANKKIQAIMKKEQIEGDFEEFFLIEFKIIFLLVKISIFFVE